MLLSLVSHDTGQSGMTLIECHVSFKFDASVLCQVVVFLTKAQYFVKSSCGYKSWWTNYFTNVLNAVNKLVKVADLVKYKQSPTCKIRYHNLCTACRVIRTSCNRADFFAKIFNQFFALVAQEYKNGHSLLPLLKFQSLLYPWKFNLNNQMIAFPPKKTNL